MVTVERNEHEWRLVGDGEDVRRAAEYIEWLVTAGRSTYTQRSYAIGMAAFLRWLATEGTQLNGINRQVVVRYVRSLMEPSRRLSAASINHRLSVLSSYFAWLIARDTDDGGPWAGRTNPVPGPPDRVLHKAEGRDAPRRDRAELRRRVPMRVPRGIDPTDAQRVLDAMDSTRDKAILTLLWRTGARIGDWLGDDDRHGVLGLGLDDMDAVSRSIRVRMKGARDEHRVPVTDDFWPVWDDYLAGERGEPPGRWAWAGKRRGRTRPLRYDAFAAALHAAATMTGVRVHAHMFRHGLAQAITATAGLHVAQEVLGHRNLSTTAEFYARVDEPAMVTGVERAARLETVATPQGRSP